MPAKKRRHKVRKHKNLGNPTPGIAVSYASKEVGGFSKTALEVVLYYYHKFPHNSRVNSRIIVVLFLSFLIGYSYYATIANDVYYGNFLTIRNNILSHPSGGGEHESLGALYEKNNDFISAKREYSLAQQFGSTRSIQNISRVERKQNAPQEIHQALAVWEAFTITHPNYKDGLIQIAAFYWQLGEKQKAKEQLQKAMTLDPSYQPALQFLQAMSR